MFRISVRGAGRRPPACLPERRRLQRLYRQSVENPDEFWGEQAKAFLGGSSPGAASTTAT